MKLVVGLGNPGKKYSTNKHNIGFMLLDRYAELNNISFQKKKDCFYANTGSAILLKPALYMNNSGKVVENVIRYNKIDEMMVVSDDVNLETGDIRIRNQGSAGGHNGLKSIISSLGNSDFFRLRIGVGYDSNVDLSDYVISDFSNKEIGLINKALEFSLKLLDLYLQNDYQDMLNYFSKNKKSYSELIKNQNQMTEGGN